MKPEADLASRDVPRGFGDLEGLRRLAARLVRVYAEIANSSWADVTLSGRFVKAGTEPAPR